MEHAIRHHLDVELDDDPDLQASFADALAAILQGFQGNWNKIYEELEKLRQRIIEAATSRLMACTEEEQMPFFRMLKTEIYGAASLETMTISAGW